MNRDYETADRLRMELRGKGILIDDRSRSWRGPRGRVGSTNPPDFFRRPLYPDRGNYGAPYGYGGEGFGGGFGGSPAFGGAYVGGSYGQYAAAVPGYGHYAGYSGEFSGVQAVPGGAPMAIYGAPMQGGVAVALQPGGTLTNEQINERLLAREQARVAKQFHAADAIREELRAHGVLIDDRTRSWRASDGRTGARPDAFP